MPSKTELNFEAFSRSNTEVATTLEDVGDSIQCDGQWNYVWFEVANTGQTLADFSIMIQVTPDSSFRNLRTGATWATESDLLEYCSGAINTLASGGNAQALVRIGAVHAIKFQADSSASTTSVTVSGRLYS